MSQFGPPPMPAPSVDVPSGNGKANASVVLGFVGLIPLLGVVTAIVGLILGILGLKSRDKITAVNGIVLCSVVLLLQVAGLALLVPALGRTQNLARRTAYAANLHLIDKAILIYEEDNAGAPPVSLSALVPGCISNPAKLHCPYPKDPAQSDYFYFAPPKDSQPLLMGCESTKNHDLRNVLTSDGQIGSMSEAEFQQELAKPENAAFAEAFRRAQK